MTAAKRTVGEVMAGIGERRATVISALSAVMEEVRAVGKGDRNSQQGYQFRGVDSVVNAVGPVLRKHGVVVIPTGVEAHYRDVQTSTGKPSRECTVTARYRFYGPEGDFIDAEVPGESMDFGDKGAPKAMSVAYRILLLQALCIPTGDVDPDSTSYERAAEVDEGPQLAQPGQLRARIAKLGAAKGKSVDDVSADFAMWSTGVSITAADVELLARYINSVNAGEALV
jgi:hypothetical protein